MHSNSRPAVHHCSRGVDSWKKIFRPPSLGFGSVIRTSATRLLRWKENIQALADPNSVRMRAGVLYAVLRSNETLLPELFEDGDVVVDTVMGANGIVCGDALEWLEIKWADTGREKFHVSNRYGRNPANPNWLN